MRIPNVSERMKEAPAHALRAVFAGIGQALLLSDRMRRRFRDGEQEPGPSAQPVTGPLSAAPPPPAPATAGPATAAPPPPAPAAKPEPAPAPGPGPATAPARPAAAPPQAPAEPAPSAARGRGEGGTASPAAPPFPNYDELSIASLRARMRGLDVSQLRDLISYERAHAAREDVIAMFERRISKLTAADG